MWEAHAARARDACEKHCGYSMDIVATFAPRLPSMRLAAANPTVKDSLRAWNASATFATFGFGLVGESELCLRLSLSRLDNSGLCILTQPGFYVAGTSSMAAFAGSMGARISVW